MDPFVPLVFFVMTAFSGAAPVAPLDSIAPDPNAACAWEVVPSPNVSPERNLLRGVAAFGALMTVLTRWGSMPLKDVVAPALELARNGFPVSEGLRNQHKYGIAPMQASARQSDPAGRPPDNVGSRQAAKSVNRRSASAQPAGAPPRRAKLFVVLTQTPL